MGMCCRPSKKNNAGVMLTTTKEIPYDKDYRTLY